MVRRCRVKAPGGTYLSKKEGTQDIVPKTNKCTMKLGAMDRESRLVWCSGIGWTKSWEGNIVWVDNEAGLRVEVGWGWQIQCGLTVGGHGG